MAIRIVAVIFFLAGELLCVMTILPPLIDVSGVVWTGLVAIAISFARSQFCCGRKRRQNRRKRAAKGTKHIRQKAIGDWF